MRIFITGGMGFIGSYLVAALLGRGYELTILARDPGKIGEFERRKSIKMLKGGMEDSGIIAGNIKGHDACIHNALFWGNTAVEMVARDTLSSVFFFETAAEAGIKHMIYTSSTAALGEFRDCMDEEMKSKPVNYYCATKAATEEYLSAVSYQYPMRCNIIRPGYTFGNPVVKGAPMEIDTRFRDIVKCALTGRDIKVAENDGTQFIWAGDLARIYLSVLESDFNRDIFFGLGREYISWERIARKTVEITSSKSRIIKEENGPAPVMFNLEKIKTCFGYSFEAWDRLVEHIEYLAEVLN